MVYLKKKQYFLLFYIYISKNIFLQDLLQNILITLPELIDLNSTNIFSMVNFKIKINIPYFW